MSGRTIQALAMTGTLVVVCVVLLPPRPLSGQTGQTEAEDVYTDEYGTTVRFRDEDGVLVERFTASGPYGSPFVQESFYDDDGNVEKEVTRYPDGRSVTEYRVHGRRLSDEGRSYSLALGRNMSREEMEGFLDRLPPLPGTSMKAELDLWRGRPRPDDEVSSDSGHPWGRHWKEVGDGFTRTTFRLLHQEMEVESVRLAERWRRIRDSRGGERHDYYTKTAVLEQDGHSVPYPAVASYDAYGRIVHVVTNDEGYPIETWYGETLVARYHYAHVDGVRPLPLHGGLGDFWVELIDARTGSRLLDSRALPTTSAKPVFSALGSRVLKGWGVIRSVGDELFAVVAFVDHSLPSLGRYALLPLRHGPVWRMIEAAGTEATKLRSLVHYTDDRLRIEFRFDHTDLVVEAPRRGSSAINVTWPQGITLPLRR